MFVILAISVSGGVMVITSINAVTQANTVNAIIPLTGHVSIIQQDDNGNIKKYVETDNLILNSGENCISKMLFAGAGQETNVVCTGAVTEPFTYIALGQGAINQSPDSTSTDVIGYITAYDLGISKADNIVWTNASSTNSQAQVVISKDFVLNGGPFDAITVLSIGLFNGTDISTNSMFAHHSPNFTLISGEVTTIEWTINIGN